MMKLLIGSDIHGSAYYCRMFMEAIEKENPGRVLLLGDLLYHGPRNALPKEYDPPAVIGMLNGMKDRLFCVRGNCDTEVDQMVLDFPILADYAVIPLENRVIYATHGHRFHPDCPPPLGKGDILLNGHTHVPANQKRNDFVYLNSGSVSIPKENSFHSYMVLENEEFLWKNLLTGEKFDRFSLKEK